MMDCISNLRKCKASCCRGVAFTNIKKRTNLIILDTLSLDMKYYYELHDLEVKKLSNRKWAVIIPNKLYKEVKLENEILTIPVICQALKSDNRCRLHGTERKPHTCRSLDERMAGINTYLITEGCIIDNTKTSIQD